MYLKIKASLEKGEQENGFYFLGVTTKKYIELREKKSLEKLKS